MSIEDVPELVSRMIKDISSERLQAIKMLRQIVEDSDECQYDHHGYCQTHGTREARCVYDRAKAFLKDIEEKESYE